MNGKYISVLKLTLVEMGTNKRKSSELKKGSLLWSRQTQNDKINWTDSLFAGIMPSGIWKIDHIDNIISDHIK